MLAENCSHLCNSVTKRQIDLQNSLVGMAATPLGNLLRLDILQSPLVETDPDGGAKPLLTDRSGTLMFYIVQSLCLR